ncbi:MAG: mandelate racemase/muconate lactonizing enzyme family protein [Candidatus Nealsonbacteria bacterium]|nr:mandelate racemase/muconate lactonizing enzyme family protein [Candidatus Nealsonbacteria bacterium]
MQINDLEFFSVAIGKAGSDRAVRSMLLRTTTDSGREGWGEAAIGWGPGELPARRDALLAVLAGRNIFDVEELHTLDALADPAVRSAVEMACWDLAGRATGQPLCRLLGGAYRRRIPLAVRLDEGHPRRVAQDARELAEQGFHCQILSASGQIQLDLKRLSAIREVVGDRAELRLDGARAYDLETALELCAELDTDGDAVQLLLDPLDTAEFYPVASLARQTRVPLALWRTVASPADVLAVVRCDAARYVTIDPGLLGGLVPARKCTAVAEAAALHVLLAGAPSVGIATAAMLHLAAATPAFSSCNECASHQTSDDVLTEPSEIIDGRMAVPQGPGLGVEVDRAKVERYQIG